MNKLRLGVIGTGSVVREIYQYLYFQSEYSSLLSIEGAADPDAQALHDFADKHQIPRDRVFGNYEEMIDRLDLDAVQVNTPDSLHCQPTVHALARGLDVMLPKPLAETISDAHVMLAAARDHHRLMAVDFHKRDDPRIREVAAQYQRGVYGRFQTAVWYMLDKLLVADPNHTPRFFASADFAEKNSPISFLTVHMVDAFLRIVSLRPTRVRTVAFAQKLPSLRPVAVNGYDLCDTEIVFSGGGVAHIITGWHLPNTAPAITVQSARIICTDGLVDLALDASGLRDITAEGIEERNSLFRNFETDGTVSGYGMDYPGRLYETLVRHRDGNLGADEYAEMMSPFQVGFWATVVCEAAQQSLARGTPCRDGVVHGAEIEAEALLRERLGGAAEDYL